MPQPAKASSLRVFGRIAALTCLSAVFLWGLKLVGALDLGLFWAAFRNRNAGLPLGALALVLLSVLSAVRSRLLLKKLCVAAKLPDVLAAGFISQAVGQWMPGSMMVIELIRFGLVSGMTHPWSAAGSDRGRNGLAARVATAFLLDRVLGLGAMFIAGALCAGALCIWGGSLVRYPVSLAVMAAISLAIGALLLLAPQWAKARFSRTLAAAPAGPAAAGRSAWARIGSAVRAGMRSLAEAPLGPRDLLRPLVLSFALAVLNPLTLAAAAWAIGRPLSLPAIITAVPFTLLAIIFPLGLAGFGGQQAMAAGAFSVFRVSPETVVAASLVQNVLALVVFSVCGGIAAGAVSGRLAEILRDGLGRFRRPAEKPARSQEEAGRSE